MNNHSASLRSFFLRDLASLRLELEAYEDERLIWKLPPGLPNSAGTLALHLVGNLQHYIGAVLGGTGYVRDRDAEFADRHLTRREILDRIGAAEQAIEATMPKLDAERLAAPYGEALRGQLLDTHETLIHLAVHLGYHLGQISYHRRIVTGDPMGVGALDPAPLSTARPASE